MANRSAFTLVEMLAVVAVIIVLLSIAMSGMQHASETSMQVRCLNNTHQVYLACVLYSGDNKRQIFRVANATGNWPHEFRDRGTGDPGNPALGLHKNRQGELQGYLPDGQMFFCPGIVELTHDLNYNPYPVNFCQTVWGTYTWLYESFNRHLASKDVLMVDCPATLWDDMFYQGRLPQPIFVPHLNAIHEDGCAKPTGVDTTDPVAVDIWFGYDPR